MESCKEDEEPIIAKKSKISRKILSGIKFMKKCVTVLSPKSRSSRKVAPEPIQSVPVEIRVQSAMKSAMHNEKTAEDNQTVDQCEEQNYCSRTHENNDEVFAQCAIQFSKPAKELLVAKSFPS